jgi:REP element-mobilizing transposase RayT
VSYTQYGRPASRPNRRSIRLTGYDYTQPGAYFVTICTQDRACLSGEVVDGVMVLNAIGQIVDDEWRLSATLRNEIELDECVVMPNHVHGIVVIDTTRRGDRPVAPTTHGVTCGPKPRSLGAFIAGFKSTVTKRINEMRNTPGVSVWQRNYYEHIIRNDESLNSIREYIINNPLQWELDRENPNIVGAGFKPAPTEDEPWLI